MNNSVLVIIVTYNAMQWIKKCIQSVGKSEHSLNLFIVDNMSTDGTAKYIEGNYPYIKLIKNKKNLGFGAANNIGLQYAIDNGFDYVYLLNQDAWIKPDTIRLLIEASRAFPQYGILSPMQFQKNEIDLDLNFNIIYSKTPKNNQSISSVKYVMAAHWLISRKCIIEVGGFSPTFHHYGEDDNYCDRARFKGFKIGIVTKAKAVHDRESRETSAEKKLYLSFVRTMVFLSGFEKTSIFAIYGFACDCLKFLLKEKSFSCMIYIKKIIRDFKQIKKNKKKSLSKTAFLSNGKELV